MQPQDVGIGRLFWHIREAVIVGDADSGRIVLWNPAAEALFKYSSPEAVGQPIEMLVPERLRAQHRAGLDGYRVSGRGHIIDAAAAFEVPALRQDGREITVELMLSPIEDARVKGRFVLALVRDVSQRRRAEDERLAAIVQSSDDAIISETLDGILTSWNPGAERIYGYRAEEVLGQPRSIIIPPERRDEFPEMRERLQRGEHIDHFETERVRKDGRRITMSVSMSPIRDAAGRIVGAAGIGRDITALKEAEQEREELLARERAARTEAEAAVRQRDEFVAVAAHELRTPLTTLLAHAQMALQRTQRSAGSERDDPTSRSLAAIDREAGRLSRLITQLLDISRLEGGQLPLERQVTDLRQLVQEAATAAAARAGQHVINVRAPASVSALVDPLRLEQVLTNLLDNAMKYSPEGGQIEVRVSRAPRGSVTIAVRDHGLGIPPAKRPHIFERFFQAHADQRASGMGLGLYISRQIVQLHGGEIRAEFPEDGGVRFVVRLPSGVGEPSDTTGAT